MDVRSSGIVIGAAALFVLSSCGGAAGEAVRPKDLTAQAALTPGAAPVCTGEPKEVRPLIVDLDADTRTDLEAAMRSGVVVVAYDCQSLRILPRCSAGKNDYQFARVTRKEQVLQLKTSDEVSANMPLSGGKIGGQVQSGRSLDLGLVFVGLKSTAVNAVDRSELVGSCDGATHYMQNASIGAFSMATGSVGKVAAMGELFKVGASASSESSRQAATTDGSLEACRADEDLEAKTPPKGCGAALRVQLMPIAGAKSTTKIEKGAKLASEQNPCPSGFFFAGGICTKSQAEGHTCDSKDANDCKAQCDKGSLESCYNYAQNLYDAAGGGRAKPDVLALYTRGCNGNHAESCGSLGDAMLADDNAPVDAVRDGIAKGLPLLKKACGLGSAIGCQQLAAVYNDKRLAEYHDAKEGFAMQVRACSLGDPISCTDAAMSYAKGTGTTKDVPTGLDYFARACQAGQPNVCLDLGQELAKGTTFPKDLGRSFKLLQPLCDDAYDRMGKGDQDAFIDVGMDCDYAAEVAWEMGQPDVAFKLAQKACSGRREMGCQTLAQLQESGSGTEKDVDSANSFYKARCKKADSDQYRLHPACPGFLAGKGGQPTK